jgi:hypothetical protein
MDQGSEYIVGWGTLALINTGLAQGKNRSGFGWFLLSLVLGPIATLALVAFAPTLPPPSLRWVPPTGRSHHLRETSEGEE